MKLSELTVRRPDWVSKSEKSEKVSNPDFSNLFFFIESIYTPIGYFSINSFLNLNYVPMAAILGRYHKIIWKQFKFPREIITVAAHLKAAIIPTEAICFKNSSRILTEFFKNFKRINQMASEIFKNSAAVSSYDMNSSWNPVRIPTEILLNVKNKLFLLILMKINLRFFPCQKMKKNIQF